MLATKQSYAAEEAAGRVLPSVAPLAVDPVPEVRHAALTTLEAFVKLLQEHSATRDSAAAAADPTSQQVHQISCVLHQVCAWTQLPLEALVNVLQEQSASRGSKAAADPTSNQVQ